MNVRQVHHVVSIALAALGLGASSARPDGLTGANSQLWHQDVQTAGVDVFGMAASDDQFGRTLAAGDFDNNGYTDLAIGVPFDDESGAENGGAVNIINGAPSGLTSAANRILAQDSFPDTPSFSRPEIEDRFGTALAVGDFNGDVYDDLAIGTPDEDVGSAADAGWVDVLYGTPLGLDPQTANAFVQEAAAGQTTEASEYFGDSLAVGDFNHDGYDDLAVGSPGEWYNGLPNAGLVSVFYGSITGLRGVGSISFRQGSGLLSPLIIEQDDHFGAALAAGDFDGDGYDDLAVGAPGESLTAGPQCGTVQVVYGSASGLDLNRRENFYQGSDGVHDSPEAGDNFGRSLAAGMVGLNIEDALIIGAPNEDLATVDCGAVHVLFGRGAGLLGGDSYFLHQDQGSMLDQCDGSEQFGNKLAVGDFNNDGNGDIAVGYYESSDVYSGVGAVHVVYSTATGPQDDGYNQIWHQDSPGVSGDAFPGELFGFALAAADFNNDSVCDLAVGVPFDVAGQVNAAVGSVNILLGTPADPPRWHQGAAPLGGDWYRFTWLGDFAVMPGGWIWHNRHGFMYSASVSSADIWFWTLDMGWLWTSEYTYPFMYRINDGAWLWYQRPSSQPRWFHNFSTSTWERH